MHYPASFCDTNILGISEIALHVKNKRYGLQYWENCLGILTGLMFCHAQDIEKHTFIAIFRRLCWIGDRRGLYMKVSSCQLTVSSWFSAFTLSLGKNGLWKLSSFVVVLRPWPLVRREWELREVLVRIELRDILSINSLYFQNHKKPVETSGLR